MARVAVILVLTPTLLPAQSVPVVRLDRPEASLSEPFTAIRGVRELSNGRLLVSDGIEARVAIVDSSPSDPTGRPPGRSGGSGW